MLILDMIDNIVIGFKFQLYLIILILEYYKVKKVNI